MLTYKDSGVLAEKETETYQPKTVVLPSRVYPPSKVDRGLFTPLADPGGALGARAPP